MKKYVFLVVLTLLGEGLFAQSKVTLSEALIKKMIDKEPPTVQQIEASFLAVQQEQLSKRDQFGLRLEGEGSVYQSKERLLNDFDGGVTRSSTSYSLGLAKPTRYGMDLGLKAFAGKATNAFVSDAATAGVSMSLSIDLFQNFLGRRTDNDLKKSELNVKRARLEKKNSLKTFESNLRKIYWTLVANNEERKLLSSLVKSAKKQYKEAVNRRRSGVADSGESARYHSQWTTRTANLLSLNYKRGELLKSLRELLPELKDKEVELNRYSVDGAIKRVLACIQVIGSNKKAPFGYTDYDDIVDMLAKEEAFERKVANTYDDPNVKIVGEYSSVGRNFGFEQARDNFREDGRARTSLGLQISIPLDGRKSSTRKATQKLIKNRYQAQARSNLARVRAFHTETLGTIKTLQRILQSQKDTNKYLSKSLKVSRRKYKQARISLQELISEQDSHLQSKLSEIQSRLTIINTLIDYFSIYVDTPCELNRI